MKYMLGRSMVNVPKQRNKISPTGGGGAET